MQNHALTTLPNMPLSESDRRHQAISTAEWAAVWSPFAEMVALHPLNADGTNFWQPKICGSIAGARYTTGSQLVRNRARQARPNGAVLAIQFVKSGTVSMAFDSRRFVQRAGSIAIMDLSQPFKGSHYNAVCETIFVPKELLGFSETDAIEPVSLMVDTPEGKSLALEVELFFDLVPGASQVDYQTNTLLHLVNSIISHHRHPSSDRVEWWRARNTLIRNDIEENLGDLSLLPAQICDKFHLSRATLYRIFETDGGVRRYIQDRRLYAAVWDLAEGGTQRGRLTEVAEKWGFSSNANFNRAVKTAFGMPPGGLFRPPAFTIPARLDRRRGEFPLYDWFTRPHRNDVPVC